MDNHSKIRENIFFARVPSMGGNFDTGGVLPIYCHYFFTRALFYDFTLNYTTVLNILNIYTIHML